MNRCRRTYVGSLRSPPLASVMGFLLAAMLWTTAAAATEKRLALLIGNKAYQPAIGALVNTVNDVKILANALGKVGFEVETVEDAGRRKILSSVLMFAQKLKAAGPDAVGFFYYSGHGVARPDDRVNYLIPVDLADLSAADAWIDAVSLDNVLGELERGAPQASHFIVFDACRNELRLPIRGNAKGFLPFEEKAGMFISFSTSPNETASDAGAKSGPYAAALAAEILKPGRNHREMFHAVKVAVHESTGKRQLGWERDGMLRTHYFAGSLAAAGPTRPPPAAPIELSARVWQDIKDTTSRGALEAFIKEFPGTIYAALAAEKLKALQALPGPPPVGPGGASGSGGALMQVYYGTDRKLVPATLSTAASFSNERAGALTLGRLDVRFPRDRKVGEIPLPGMFQQHSPDKHATLRQLDVQSPADFSANLRRRAEQRRKTESGLLFVHGWNMSFEMAAFRAAQFATDIGFTGPLFLFSWTSSATMTGYVADLDRARASREALRAFYDQLARSGLREIHILAHSTGAAPVLEMFDGLSAQPDGVLGQVIFAAPDTSREAFVMSSNKISKVAKGVTLYASGDDKALKVASGVSGGITRAGEVTAQGPLIVAGVDSIDVSALSQSTFSLNHSSYAESSPMLADMARLLETGERPADRRSPAIQRVQSGNGATYWRYR